jgi:hypothetical protein
VIRPDNLKASPEGTVVTVDTFEGHSNKMEVTDLELNPEETEAAGTPSEGSKL